MVKKAVKGKKNLFKCPVCGMLYVDKKTVEECEKWCKTHKSCSLEITKKAVGVEE